MLALVSFDSKMCIFNILLPPFSNTADYPPKQARIIPQPDNRNLFSTTVHTVQTKNQISYDKVIWLKYSWHSNEVLH